MKPLVTSLLVVICSAFLPQAAWAQRVPIFVGPLTRAGFVDMDQGVEDSIRDIQKELKKSVGLVVVPSVHEATIVLTVIGRRVSGTGGAVGVTTPGTSVGGGTIAGVQQPTITTPGTTVMVPLDRRAIECVLRVGSYEKTVVSEGVEGAGWGSAAKAVARDVMAWLNANRAALAARH